MPEGVQPRRRLTRSTKSSTTCACAVSFRSARIGRRSRVRTGTSTSSCVKAPTRLATSGSSPSSWSAFASSGNRSGTSTSCSPASSLSRSGRCLARGRASSGRATRHGGRAKPGSTSHRSRPSARSRRRRRCVSTHRHLHFPYRSPADSSRAAGLRYAVLVACPHEVSALCDAIPGRAPEPRHCGGRIGGVRSGIEDCPCRSSICVGRSGSDWQSPLAAVIAAMIAPVGGALLDVYAAAAVLIGLAVTNRRDVT